MPEFSSLPPKATPAVSPKSIQENLKKLSKSPNVTVAIELLKKMHYPSQLVAKLRHVTPNMKIPIVGEIARAVFAGLRET